MGLIGILSPSYFPFAGYDKHPAKAPDALSGAKKAIHSTMRVSDRDKSRVILSSSKTFGGM